MTESVPRNPGTYLMFSHEACEHLKLVEVTGSAVRIERSFSSPDVVRDDVEVITGITERFVSRLVRVSVARYGGCLTNGCGSLVRLIH
jgi:hypothetical protein